MLKLKIRAIGRLSEPWIRSGVDMYVDRITPLAELEIIELPEGSKGSAKPDIVRAKAAEAEALLKGLGRDDILIALDETGREWTSEAFATELDHWTDHGSRTVVFAIGGSWGLDGAVKERATALLSLGKMTFPHGLARLLLTEQLYRARMIQEGRTYHK